jgi:hypothetical protein
MTRNRIVCLALALAGLLCATLPAGAEDAISHPAKKSIGSSKNDMVASLAVLNAGGASLQGNKLTLTDVSPTPSSSPIAPCMPQATC